MALKEILDRLYGVKTDSRINPLTATVLTTPTPLLIPNPNRLAWTLINLSANFLFLCFTQNVSATNGIYVSQTGGVMGLLYSEDFNLVTLPVWGLADTANCTVYLVEIIAL